MNIPDALHCSGCGRALGLEPAGSSDYLRCPRCDVELEKFRGAQGSLRDCARCGGQFVEHALVRDLLERSDLYGVVAPRRSRKFNALDDPVTYIKCPECRNLMNRKNFGGSSGIIVDVCLWHGIWFDEGELPRVLAFVEAGGLAAQRHVSKEPEPQGTHAPVFKLAQSAHDVTGVKSWDTVFVAAVTALLAWLRDVIEGLRH